MADSVALSTFRTLLDLANELLGIEAAYADPPAPTDLRRVEGLRGGAAVLMVSAFEAYLKAGVAELLKPLLGPPAKPLHRLPDVMQVAAVYESLDHVMYGHRYGKSNKKLDRLPEVINVIKKLAAGEIHPDGLSQTKSNPGPDTVERLLKNIGFKKPFQDIRPSFDAIWGAPEATTFLKDKLDEIVKRRHRVAHTADITAISRADLQTASLFLLALGEAIDKAVQNHVAAL
jgi:hypothetical protein